MIYLPPGGGDVDGSQIALAGQVSGDVMYFNGTSWIVLPKGTASQTLKMNGGATAPTWVTVAAAAAVSYGTYEPTVTFPGTGSVDASWDTLSYAVDDDIVHVNGQMKITHDGTGGDITLSLPYASVAGGNEAEFIMPVRSFNIMSSDNVFLSIPSGSSTGSLLYNNEALTGSKVTGDMWFWVSGWYRRATP